MTLYGYARVSVREPDDKNHDLRVERLLRAGCAMSNIRSEEANGAKNDRGGLLERRREAGVPEAATFRTKPQLALELLDLVVVGDTLVVTHIDRLSRGLTTVSR